MDIVAYRMSEPERVRSADLMALIPDDAAGSALDVGARDGWFSIKLADRFDRVVALDLNPPEVKHAGVARVLGDVTGLGFMDQRFDLVFCAEVLEHVPTHHLVATCKELQRVSKRYIVIGVPFQQDLRYLRTTCRSCGRKNPPWGHVNVFDENRLKYLFPLFRAKRISHLFPVKQRTNALSTLLMDFAGNSDGTYHQEERCIYCGARLAKPERITAAQWVAWKVANLLILLQRAATPSRPKWIHVLYERRE